MVFFDVLGVFMVAYPARVGTIINYMVTVAAFIYLGKKCSLPNNVGVVYMRSLVYAIGVTLMSWFITLVSVLIIAVLISLTGQSMFWYTHYYVSVCLYGTAGIGMLMLIHTLAKNHYYGNMNQLQVGEMYFEATLTLWCCALVYLTQQGLCSAYVPMITVVFPLITKLLLRQEIKQRGATVKYTALYLLGLSLPYVHFMFLMWVVFEIFTPILGRSGTEIPPDVVLASITAGCVIILSSYFIHFIYLSKSMKRTLVVLASIFGVVAVLVSCGMFFPYSCDSASPRPKRIFLQVRRAWRERCGHSLWVKSRMSLMSSTSPQVYIGPDLKSTT
ncbi:UNVERIFIED_CONTAM: hypothetical protein FKN15_029335 [Acipenser sinensis]